MVIVGRSQLHASISDMWHEGRKCPEWHISPRAPHSVKFWHILYSTAQSVKFVQGSDWRYHLPRNCPKRTFLSVSKKLMSQESLLVVTTVSLTYQPNKDNNNSQNNAIIVTCRSLPVPIVPGSDRVDVDFGEKGAKIKANPCLVHRCILVKVHLEDRTPQSFLAALAALYLTMVTGSLPLMNFDT